MKLRAFVSVDIHPSSRLSDLLNDLKGCGPGLRVVKHSNLHLTLKFLGNTEEGQIEDVIRLVESSTTDIQPFEIKLSGMGAFPSLSNVRIIWVGVENGKNLEVLAERLDISLAALGFKRERRAYRPHLTVARTRGGGGLSSARDLIAMNAATDYGDCVIDRVTLKKSVLTPEGPIYSDIREIKLD